MSIWGRTDPGREEPARAKALWLECAWGVSGGASQTVWVGMSEPWGRRRV